MSANTSDLAGEDPHAIAERLAGLPDAALVGLRTGGLPALPRAPRPQDSPWDAETLAAVAATTIREEADGKTEDGTDSEEDAGDEPQAEDTPAEEPPAAPDPDLPLDPATDKPETVFFSQRDVAALTSMSIDAVRALAHARASCRRT